jgi:signal transduction histidine kinase
MRWRDGLELCVQDDGAGMGAAPSESGHGLGLHSAMLAVLGGRLVVENAPEGGACACLFVPREAMGGW